MPRAILKHQIKYLQPSSPVAYPYESGTVQIHDPPKLTLM